MVFETIYSMDEPLHLHVSAPPEVLHEGVKTVAKDSLIHGNFKEHWFKHVSDPPCEEFSNDEALAVLMHR